MPNLDAQIGIIGLSCRAPGANDSVAFWRLLLDARVVTGSWPASRRGASAIWSESERASARVARAMVGGYLDDVARFDATLFGISAREAGSIDPQHRLMMESAWLALQDAGLDPRKLAGSRTAVFAALSSIDYALLCHEAGARVNAYGALGSSKSLAANRISYALNLRGPSVGVDSACSSALVAVQLARQALHGGDCDLALVVGCNVVLVPTINAAFARARMLSPSGRCSPFRNNADGYLRSEGVAAIVLKRLPDALHEGDPLHAVIVGLAVNQDGHTPGITVPSRDAQVDVVERAWRQAGITADEIAIIEAHGTGTPVGDAIELAALTSIFTHRSATLDPCLLASLKANIGHTEAAAGLFSIIKLTHALRERVAPPHAGEGSLVELQPAVRDRVRIPEEPTPLSGAGGEKLLYAAASAFGFGGTNAHVVLRQPPGSHAREPRRETPLLVTVSAHTTCSAQSMAHEWAERLSGANLWEAADLAMTSRHAYAGEACRLHAVGSTASELMLTLRQALPSQPCSEPARVIGTILLGQANGMSDGELDLFDPAVRDWVRRTRRERGAEFGDLAAQLSAITVLRPVLDRWPARLYGAHPLALEAWVERFNQAAVEQAVGNAVINDELVVTSPGTVEAPTLLLGMEPTSVVGSNGQKTSCLSVGPAMHVTMRTLGALWNVGASVRLDALPAAGARVVHGAPHYAFNRLVHWHSHSSAPIDAPIGELPLSIKSDRLVDFSRFGYLRDHRIDGVIIVPGATLIDVVLTEVSDQLGSAQWQVADAVFETALVLDQQLTEPEVRLELAPVDGTPAAVVTFVYWVAARPGRTGLDEGGRRRVAWGILERREEGVAA